MNEALETIVKGIKGTCAGIKATCGYVKHNPKKTLIPTAILGTAIFLWGTDRVFPAIGNTIEWAYDIVRNGVISSERTVINYRLDGKTVSLSVPYGSAKTLKSQIADYNGPEENILTALEKADLADGIKDSRASEKDAREVSKYLGYTPEKPKGKLWVTPE